MSRCRQILLATLAVALLHAGCSRSTDYNDTGHRCDIAYLWSLSRDNSVAIKEVAAIEGMVIANDKLNEVTKRIIVVDNSGGIEIAIEAEDIDEIIPLYSTIRVNVAGLHIGRQGKKCILGTRPTGEYVVDRIKERDLPLYITPLSKGELVSPKQMRIADIENRHLLHYVYIENVQFIDEEQGLEWCDLNDEGHYVESIRHITDGIDTLRVVCAGECIYASAQIPSGRHNVYGVVDYAQRDIALRVVDNQVLSTGVW
jgi:hypothetical protein